MKEQLRELLEKKRALTKQFKSLKGSIRINTSMGVIGLMGTDLNQFEPLGKIISDLLEVNDQITELMAATFLAKGK